jgi:hypothetical protein
VLAPDAVEVRDLDGIRVVARPDAIDRAKWLTGPGSEAGDGAPLIFRFAPDEAFAAVGRDGSVEIDDPDAVVVAEPGYLCLRLDRAGFAGIAAPHIEWAVPTGPAFTQGAVANVPAKVLVDRDGGAWILVAKAHEHEFRDRLGIRS